MHLSLLFVIFIIIECGSDQSFDQYDFEIQDKGMSYFLYYDIYNYVSILLQILHETYFYYED